MSEGRDWTVYQENYAVKICIEDCKYSLKDSDTEKGLAAIAHAILLLQDTLVNESEKNRDADDDRYEDARDRYSRIDEKRQELENAIEEMMNTRKDPWVEASKSSPCIPVIVKMADGVELNGYYSNGKFLSSLGIEFANVKSWRYPECKSE